MSSKPIALFITPTLPQPGGSGRALRAWDWLKELSIHHSVHIFTLDTEESISLPSNYPAKKIWRLPYAKLKVSRWRRAAGLLFPFLAIFSRSFIKDWHRFSSDEVPTAIYSALASQNVIKIIVFRLYLHDIGVSLANKFPQADLELDFDDLESITRKSVAAALLRMSRLLPALKEYSSALQYRMIEQRTSKRYRCIYLAAKEDASLQASFDIPLICRPNRIAIPDNFPVPQKNAPFRLLFIGTLNYPPNEEAVRELIENLVPVLAANISAQWELIIVGKHASPTLARLINGTSVQVHWLNDVEDLAKVYENSHCILVPLRAGGGTKLKTLEGFAHQRPVISTREGVRGLDVVSGEHYLLAETTQEFAYAICTLMHNHSIADQIALAGWSLCQKKYRSS